MGTGVLRGAGVLGIALAAVTAAVGPVGDSRRHPLTGSAVRSQGSADYGRLPLSFEPNLGQAPPGVAYLARGPGYGVAVGPAGARLALTEGPHTPRADVDLVLVGGEPAATISASQPLPGRVNHFVGDPSRWHRDIATYARVTAAGVWPGVDVAWYGNQGQLEYDFVVLPGADPGRIGLSLQGGAVQLNGDGALTVMTRGGGRVVQRPPVAYQDGAEGRQNVSARYVVEADRIGIALGAYDPTRPLIVDPVLAFSTYLGGAGGDVGNGIGVDATGNAVVVGETASYDFPLAVASDSTYGGETDAFVSRVDSSGSSLLYSTYLGGTGFDSAASVAVDPQGRAYVVGSTGSADFPTHSAVQATFGGIGDAFVTKLDAAGGIVYSTYLGGAAGVEASGDDVGTGIALDGQGCAYVTGATFSPNFPVVRPVQSSLAGSYDAFAAKLTPTGAGLAYSTYLGGTAHDAGESVAVDPSGAVVMTGSTASGDFPSVAGRQRFGGIFDAFVTRLSVAGTQLLYSTYLGGSETDQGHDVAVDRAGNAYVAGGTASTDFPVWAALDAGLGGQQDGFVAKLTTTGTFAYSTYLGGTGFAGSTSGGDDEAYGVAVDSSSRAAVTGLTQSSDFPLRAPIQPASGGLTDAFVSILDPTGMRLEFSTYLGGGGVDAGRDVAVRAHQVLVTGRTGALGSAPPFPTSAGAVQPARPDGPFPVPFVARVAFPAGPRAGDFDGDGTGDVALFRPGGGLWFVEGGGTLPFGTGGDIPVPGDYNGDQRAEFAVFRPASGAWFVAGAPWVLFGMQGDVPVPADYDGDGDTDIAVFRPQGGVWFISGIGARQFGMAGDVPVPADYDGDGDADVAVYRPSTGYWFFADGTAAHFGMWGDIALPADYDGDGDADPAVFRPSSGVWFVAGGEPVQFGTWGDIPAPADYDGDGDVDMAVFRHPSGSWFFRGGPTFIFGTYGDVPVPLADAVRVILFPPP